MLNYRGTSVFSSPPGAKALAVADMIRLILRNTAASTLTRRVDISGLSLAYWGRDKMAAISQTTFSNAFSWMKMFEFPIKISLKFVPKGPINYISALVQIMAWRRPGDKPLSETMMVRLLTHIYASLGLNEFKGIAYTWDFNGCFFRLSDLSAKSSLQLVAIFAGQN